MQSQLPIADRNKPSRNRQNGILDGTVHGTNCKWLANPRVVVPAYSISSRSRRICKSFHRVGAEDSQIVQIMGAGRVFFLRSQFSLNAIARSVLWVALVLIVAFPAAPAVAQNEVTLEVVDEESGEPVASRIEFVKSAKKLNRDRKMLISGDTWLAEGKLVLQPPPGEYEFLAKRGPEYKEIRGGFTIERRAKDVVVIELPRAVDMHSEHWYSGDLGVELDRDTAGRWQIADAVDMVVTNRRAQKRDSSPTKNPKAKKAVSGITGNSDQLGVRWGGASLEYLAAELGIAIHGIETSDTALSDGTGETALGWRDAWDAIEASRDADRALIEITQPGVRDTPFLLADPKVKLVRVLSSVNRPKGDDALSFPKSGDTNSFASVLFGVGKDRVSLPIQAPVPDDERIRFKGARGVGKLNEFLYWKMLEAGLRLAPSAASGFGRGDTHVGYNRVYVHCDSPGEERLLDSTSEKNELDRGRSDRGGESKQEGMEPTDPSEDAWWHGLEHGASFITNGPLLRAIVNGSPPGSVHPGYRGEPIPLDIAVSLAVREKVDYLDVIFNGETLYNAKLEDHYKRGEFPELTVSESGWLVIRVVTAHDDGYRYASTAPFYFEFEGKPRVSKKSVEFFQGWLERSIEAIDRDDEQRLHYADRKESARQFWDNLKSRATVP